MPVEKCGRQRYRARCPHCRWQSRLTTDRYGAAVRLTAHLDLVHRAPLWRLDTAG